MFFQLYLYQDQREAFLLLVEVYVKLTCTQVYVLRVLALPVYLIRKNCNFFL